LADNKQTLQIDKIQIDWNKKQKTIVKTQNGGVTVGEMTKLASEAYRALFCSVQYPFYHGTGVEMSILFIFVVNIFSK
jgi:hypothetical protein